MPGEQMLTDGGKETRIQGNTENTTMIRNMQDMYHLIIYKTSPPERKFLCVHQDGPINLDLPDKTQPFIGKRVKETTLSFMGR